MRKITISIIVLSLVLLSSPVLASLPDFTNVTNKGGHSFSLPTKAVEVAENVWSLGVAYDKHSDSFVEGYAIVHKKGNAKSQGVRAPKTPTCYAFMASGAKWKSIESWSVFPGAGLGSTFLLNNLGSNMGKWEVAAGQDIFGAVNLGVGTPGDPNVLDSKNEVSFGNLDSGTIAVTVVWGVFGGPVSNRQLVAWDQIYNTDFTWTENALVDPTKMDFENIATHELGHAIGLSDIYNSSCNTVTMFGYGTEGETQKRDLAPADILGASTLY